MRWLCPYTSYMRWLCPYTSSLEQIDLRGSAQGDFFDMNGTPAGMTYSLLGNAGADDFRINASNLLSRINVRGGQPTTAPGDCLRVYGTRVGT